MSFLSQHHLLFFAFAFASLALFHFPTLARPTCSSPPANVSSCPPFTSAAPPFPFAASPGCGHPSFQVRCASPHSVISINGLSFSLVEYQSNSTTLTLSPRPSTTPASHRNCSSFGYNFIPGRPISLSGSPFRISESSCSRLSVLRPCSPPNLPNCSHCPWECKLIKSPVRLLQDCGSTTNRAVAEQGCRSDVLDYLDGILKLGIQIEWSDQDSYYSNCSDCQGKNGVCGFNSSDPEKPFLCFQSRTRFSPPWVHQDDSSRIAILCSVFVFTCVVFVAVVVLVIFRSLRLKSLVGGEDPTVLFLHRHRSANLLPPVFTYEELDSSTNHFDPKRKIGDGGFGSVYLGQLFDGRIVAVKHLHRQNASAAGGRTFFTKSFCNEILILSSIDHPNLVKLHGYCSDPRGLLLVYDYVPNGTLADHLHGGKSLCGKGALTWQVRVDIALQTAMAMEYLHFSVEPAIVHRDITSSNIFLERDMRIKVGDFGLSRLLIFPETTSSSSSTQYVWTGPQGTPGYLDPEYHRSFRLTEKSDVYSFGVVLMELISGKKAVDQNRDRGEMTLVDLVVSRIHMGLLRQVLDPILAADGEAMQGVGAVAELAFRCVAADKDDRPDAREVVTELKRVRNRTRGVRVGNQNNEDGARV
ncbi:LEAF RUST 10 DISEASE-RESISTANCE LOCUS RECEPTOR-LIKE PROTEIN KINASE-like 1.5 [Malania oleifera]|uniref:LEAF RUST 10 DISEASE-RESISTANCE LOCUS RECEPTOR-LIKE PROTEIN KINASE-like 1.5 n=1 Tax=Malania oleifera TaxID=397392 RepID=UPI0025AE5B1B|nr:LEAF RUST 10 DISEASE-RESISTANCE LOCUS RECEPTOR-LIKE PROTEIN KINASE-like 1.5 [Malania oleifera]